MQAIAASICVLVEPLRYSISGKLLSMASVSLLSVSWAFQGSLCLSTFRVVRVSISLRCPVPTTSSMVLALDQAMDSGRPAAKRHAVGSTCAAYRKLLDDVADLSRSLARQ